MFKVSVIIPTYKPGDYLVDCLESLDAQTLCKAEYCVYIGLNGPKDNYEEFVLHSLGKFGFNYRYCYISIPGVSQARNHLLNVSKSRYVVFVDDDDLISPIYLESLLNVTNDEVMGLANIINFKGDLSNLFENYIGKSFLSLDSEGDSYFDYRKYFSSPCAKMLSRKMISNLKFDQNLERGEDGLFMANISKNISSFKKGDAAAIYYVNCREGSSSRKDLDKIIEFKKLSYLLIKYLKLLKDKDYNSIFIITRVLSVIRHLIKLISK